MPGPKAKSQKLTLTKKETTYQLMENLRRWLRGDARREDEQHLEKAAAQDPFLADAMEGYRQFAESDHDAAMIRLRQRLHERTGDRKGGFVLWRVAAAVVFLVVAAGIFWVVNDRFELNKNDMAYGPETDQTETVDEKESPTAPTEEKAEKPVVKKEPKQVATAPGKSKKNIQDVRIDRPAREQSSPAEIADAAPIAGVRKDNIEPQAPSLVLEEVQIESVEEAPEKIVVADEVARQTPTEDGVTDFSWSDVEAEFAKDSIDVILPEERQYIIGTVLADNNEPIIGVNISALGTQLTTLTNIKGQFRLEWTPDIEKLELYSKGFEKTMAEVPGPGTLSVKMTHLNDALKTDVASSAEPAAGQARARSTFIGQTQTQPVGGFEDFEAYIKKNKRLPGNLSGGEVLLQFVVEPDGRITSIKPLQSSTKSLESEAIRLLTEGPKWDNPTASPEVVEYVVKF